MGILFKILCLTYLRSIFKVSKTKNEKLSKPRSFHLFCGFVLIFIKIRVSTMDKDYNGRQVFDLSRKAHFFADSVISAELTCIPWKCNFLLILPFEYTWKELQGKTLLQKVNWQKRYTNSKWRMTNFNVILLSFQQREVK